MTFADKLRMLRKQAGMSQEKMAEKLGVSRQAITKWETNGGVADIENLMAISALFDISIDELVSNEKMKMKRNDYLYESVTEYDIDEVKHFDMKLGSAHDVIVSGYDGEKLRIRLASNHYSSLESNCKVKIDDVKKRIDVEVHHKNDLTDMIAKEEITMFVMIPNAYAEDVELQIQAANVEVNALQCEMLELDAKACNFVFDDVTCKIELNCNLDMNIICHSLSSYISINQISATSKLYVPENVPFTVVSKGRKTSISFEENGKKVEPFAIKDAAHMIELNGLNSELVISRMTDSKSSCDD